MWLNNPRRGEEACGTSGMKAAINGVLNLSILDGWFDEAYENFRRLGHRRTRAVLATIRTVCTPAPSTPARKRNRPHVLRASRADAARVDAPRQAVAHPHQPGLRLPPHGPRVHDASYTSRRTRRICACARRLRLSREKAQWNARIREVWDRVRFVDAGPGPGGAGHQRQAVPVRAAIDWPVSTPGDVRVEVVIGRVDTNGHLEETEVMVLPAVEQHGSVAVFAKDIVPERTGRLGYALRVSPNHYDDPLTRPCTQSAEMEFGRLAFGSRTQRYRGVQMIAIPWYICI